MNNDHHKKLSKDRPDEKFPSTKSTPLLEPKYLFFGTTTNPLWSTLPLEEAIVLIPGRILYSTFWRMVSGDNPDAVVLRFLRGRRWDVDASYKMLMNTLRWRIHMRVDDIVTLGETGLYNELESLKPGMGGEFLANLHSYKCVLGGPDKQGRGICFANARFHRKEDQVPEVLRIVTIFLMECARIIVHQPVETCCLVFNMEGFTLANMDFEFVKFMLVCFEAYYPETLGLCLIHKAPWVFSTVWAMVAPMLDPVVASKVRFTRSVKELYPFVDRHVLPAFLTEKGAFKPNHSNYKAPPTGKLNQPKTQEYLDYETMVEEYMRYTRIWVRTNASAMDKERRQQALQYRHASINAEDYIRGRTSYHDMELAEVEKGRLLLKFSGKAPTLDITDCV
ncbi:CRAL-TRIO domain-containing protein [Chlamydoabsidia padenii]|nr:CRAL-TRIO domain-containing protein [Chlamydoabsidia padenii]